MSNYNHCLFLIYFICFTDFWCSIIFNYLCLELLTILTGGAIKMNINSWRDLNELYFDCCSFPSVLRHMDTPPTSVKLALDLLFPLGSTFGVPQVVVAPGLLFRYWDELLVAGTIFGCYAGAMSIPLHWSLIKRFWTIVSYYGLFLTIIFLIIRWTANNIKFTTPKIRLSTKMIVWCLCTTKTIWYFIIRRYIRVITHN